MLLDLFGEICWNCNLPSYKSCSIHAGGLYLSVCSVESPNVSGVCFVCSSNCLAIAIQHTAGDRTYLSSVDDCAVTDKNVLLVIHEKIYCTSMQTVVAAIRDKSDHLVLHRVQFECSSDELQLGSLNFRAVGATLGDIFAVKTDGCLCKLGASIDCASFSIEYIACESPVRQLACGNDHCVVLLDNGRVCSMGIGSRGQLGHGDLADLTTPKQLESLSTLSVMSVSAGGWHSAFLTSTGDLYLCGWNESMQLGISDLSVWSEPEPLDLPPLIDNNGMADEAISGVSCGMRHTVLWTERNTIFCLGGTTEPLIDKRKLPLDESFSRVACGHKSSLYHGREKIVCKSYDFAFSVAVS